MWCRCKKFEPKRRVWKVQQADLRDKFCETFTGEMNDTSGEQVDDIWSRLKQGYSLLQRRLVGGQRKAYIWSRLKQGYSLLQRRLVGGQRKAYGENKHGGGMKRSVRIYLRKEDCGSCGRRVGAKINIWMQNGKRNMPSTQLREMQKRRNLVSVKDNKENIFRVSKQMRAENQDVIGEKCIRGVDGNLTLDEASKNLTWKQHYERLLNIEFLWSQNLSHVDFSTVHHS